jgi:hypothetical protein
MDLLFDFMAVGNRRASVIGTMTRPRIVATTGGIDLLGVRFRPGSLPGFLGLNAAELTDAVADLTNFWGQLTQQAWASRGFSQGFRARREVSGRGSSGSASESA